MKIKSYQGPGITTYFFPILGAFQYLRSNFFKYGDTMGASKICSKQNENPKFLVTNLVNNVAIFLRDPQYIKELLQKPNFYEKTKFLHWVKPLVGNGLILTEGETWKRHRMIISGSFHYEFLKANIHVIQDTTREFLDKLTPEEMKKFPAISKIQDITGEIVGRIFFGKNLNQYTCNGKPLTLELADVTTELALCGKTPLVMVLGVHALKIPFGRFKRITDRINNFRRVCFEIVANRKANPIETTDLLASLLATQKSEDPNMKYTDEDIINEFITFFIAGMDTTGHLIGMALYSLTQNPDYFKELKEERDKSYNKEEKVSADTLSKMDAIHCVLKETLRFYNPAPFLFFRNVKEDHKLHDLDVKKGTFLTCDLFSLFFNEKYFSHAEEFDASRWKKTDTKLDPFAFIPFSAGPRNCIGQHLAIMESKVIISELLERFNISLDKNYKLAMTIRFLYEPFDEILLSLTPKK